MLATLSIVVTILLLQTGVSLLNRMAGRRYIIASLRLKSAIGFRNNTNRKNRISR